MKQHARLLVCFLMSSPLTASASTYVVDPNSTLDSIQDAIDAALPGDDVVVLPGTYFESIALSDGVDVLAQTAGSVIVDAEGEGSVVTAVAVGPATTIDGLRFQNGSAPKGGGLFAISSSPTFVNCVFASNAAITGGGAHLNQSSEAVFDGCSFIDNTASVGGGLYLDFSKVRVVNSFLYGNEAFTDGAALSANNAAEAEIEFTCIFNNRAHRGSVVACIYASPQFRNCTVASNIDDTGGGVFALRGSGARVERTIVAFNNGPAFSCDTSSPWVGCSDFYGNGDDTICAGDQGTNVSVDPLFCDPPAWNFELQSASALLGTGCGDFGAHLLGCPSVGTAVESLTWSALKATFRN